MQVSEQFAKVLRSILLSIVLIALGFMVSTTVNPPARVSAQTAGTVGIQAIQNPVFPDGTTTSTNLLSGVLQDIGAGCSYVEYQGSSFWGVIDLEFTPQGTTTPVVLAQATIARNDSNAHILPLNGYFPNLRVRVTNTAGAGTFAVNYSAISGPCPAASAALGSNGPTLPISCDHSDYVQLSSSAIPTHPLVPFNPGDTIVICGFTVSLNAAATAGNIQWIFTTSTMCGGSTSVEWYSYTSASTPQFFTVPIQIRPDTAGAVGSGQTVCVINNSGANAAISFSYASVHL